MRYSTLIALLDYCINSKQRLGEAIVIIMRAEGMDMNDLLRIEDETLDKLIRDYYTKKQ
jgi:hypothetical protein